MTDGSKKLREALAIAYNIIIRYVSERDLNKKGLKIIKKALDESKALSSPPVVEGNVDKLLDDLRRGLKCLRLECPEAVCADLEKLVWAYHDEAIKDTVRQMLPQLAEIKSKYEAEKAEIQEEANEMRKQRNLALDEKASLQSKLSLAVDGLEKIADLKVDCPSITHCVCACRHEATASETLAKVKEK